MAAREARQIEDELLAEETPSSNTSKTTSNVSLEQTLAQLNQSLTALNNRMTTLEEKNTSSTSLVGSRPTVSSPPDIDQDNMSITSDHNDEEIDLESKPEEGTDPSYLEMLTAIKSLLKLPDPEIQQVAPPSAFVRRSTSKNTKKQVAAFPPEGEIKSMWDFRHQLASGKNAQGVSQNSPLHLQQFLQYAKTNMGYYTTIPQNSTLKAQKCPESFHNLGRDRVPSFVDMPWKQSEKDERIMREMIQILERVVYFSKAMGELNTRVQGFCEDARITDPNLENVDMAITATQMQARVIDSLDTALETILNQTMSLACNTVLARRDTLLKDCKKLSCEDQLKLRNSNFTDTDLFPTEEINNAENNLLKRSATASAKPSPQPFKKRRYDGDLKTSNSFRGQSSYRGRGRGSNQQSRGSRGARGQSSSRRN